jgi:hypothetical protein
LEYLHDINLQFVNQGIGKERYTSIFPDENGEREVFSPNETSAIMGNVSMAIDTLEWILEESKVVRPVVNEQEAERYKDKIMYDGDGKALIPDTSIETFIAGIEGQY